MDDYDPDRPRAAAPRRCQECWNQLQFCTCPGDEISTDLFKLMMAPRVQYLNPPPLPYWAIDLPYGLNNLPDDD